jgi:transposase
LPDIVGPHGRRTDRTAEFLHLFGHGTGIDDWSWRKGHTYGTIIVDLERREVVDLLQDRTATGQPNGSGRIQR